MTISPLGDRFSGADLTSKIGLLITKYNRNISVMDAATGGALPTRAQIQSIIDEVGDAGGGRILFPRADYVFDETPNQEASTFFGTPRWHLLVSHDDIDLYMEPGARILHESATNSETYAIWATGAKKGGQSLSSGLYINGRPLVPPLANKAGDRHLTFADASMFDVGMAVYIRTGQCLTANNANAPDSQINRIIGKVGNTIYLDGPLKRSYYAETYPPGHPSAGSAAPFGVADVTDCTIRNFRFDGTIVSSGGEGLRTWQVDGYDVNLRKGSLLRNVAHGGSWFRDGRTRMDVDLVGDGGLPGFVDWAWSLGTGCSGNTLEDFSIRSMGSNTLHVHEGSYRPRIRRGTVAVNDASDKTVISVRARCYDADIDDVVVTAKTANSASCAIYVDDTCSGGGRIGTVTPAGALASIDGAISVRAQNWEVGQKSAGVCTVWHDPEVIDLPMGSFAPRTAATSTFVVPNNFQAPGWQLTENTRWLLAGVFEIPRSWQSATLELTAGPINNFGGAVLEYYLQPIGDNNDPLQSTATAWSAGETVSAGTVRQAGLDLYVYTQGGTTGSVAPTGREVASDASIGITGADWEYIAPYRAWSAGLTVAGGDLLTTGGALYQVMTTAGGTTGSTAPVHTSGNTSDGGVTLGYVGTVASWATNTLVVRGALIAASGAIYRARQKAITATTAPTHGLITDGTAVCRWAGYARQQVARTVQFLTGKMRQVEIGTIAPPRRGGRFAVQFARDGANAADNLAAALYVFGARLLRTTPRVT